jgi:hypothetical protein
MNAVDHGIEFLLAFDGRVHILEGGYSIKFAVKRVDASPGRSHGLSYSLTLHAPGGSRLVGFDNAHEPRRYGPGSRRVIERDHLHRTKSDPGRSYAFKDAATLIVDFFAEVERVLSERGIGTDVVSVKEAKE